jgi:predicted flap endonuclease-1-like 5' DNA nuclease
MLDRSTRTLLAVGFLLAAVLVTLWMIVRQRPIEEWWLPLLLWLLGLLLVWYWQRGDKGDAVGMEVSPPAAAAAPALRVRELVVSDAPAALPAPAAFVAKVDAPPVVSEEAQAVEEMIDEEATPEPAVVVASVTMPEVAAVETAPTAPEPAVAVSTVSMQEADVTEAPAVNVATFAAAETVADPADDLLVIEGIGPQMNAALIAGGIGTYRKVADASVQELRAAIEAKGLRFAPSLVNWSKQARFLADGDQAGFEQYRDYLLRGLEPGQVVDQNYNVTFKAAAVATIDEPATTADDTAAAKPKASRKRAADDPPKAEAAPVVPDDLKLVEGIGPKMEKALHNAGILTFGQLAAATEPQIRAAVEAAGMRFAPSIPTWAKQARYLADGDTEGLTVYQNQLTAGREG